MAYILTKSVEDRLDAICKELVYICLENHIPTKEMWKQIECRMLEQLYKLVKQNQTNVK